MEKHERWIEAIAKARKELKDNAETLAVFEGVVSSFRNEVARQVRELDARLAELQEDV